MSRLEQFKPMVLKGQLYTSINLMNHSCKSPQQMTSNLNLTIHKTISTT